MLQHIRENLQGTIAKIIMALIAVPFALFGIQSFFKGGVPEVAVVNGQTITQTELAQSIEMQRRRILAQLGEKNKVDPGLLEESALRKPVLDTLIDRTILRQTAEAASFSAAEGMINGIILGDENFQEDGKFSQARFEGMLAANGMSPALYKKRLGDEILVSQLLSGFVVSEFVTQHELDVLARITQQTVDVRYLKIPVVAPAKVVVADADIDKYFQENKADFKTSETVRVEYLELKLADLFKPVIDAEIEKEYAQRVASYKGKTERHAAHILISSLSDADAQKKLGDIRRRIGTGEDFAALAHEFSEDIGSAKGGGDLGFSSGDAFPADFEKALAALTPGAVSEPVKSEAGWHLIKLLEARTQEAPSLASMRSEIELALQKKTAEPHFVEKSEQLADLTFNSEGLDEAASKLDLKTVTSEPFAKVGGTGLFGDKRVVNAAFNPDLLDGRQNSEVIELANDHVLVLRVVDHQLARQQELDEVKDRIRAVLAESLARKQTATLAEQLVVSLRGGKSVEDAAKAAGFEWQLVLAHHRREPGLAPEVSDAVFAQARSTQGNTYGSVALPAGDIVVYEISNFKEGSLASLSAEQQKSILGAVREANGREVSERYRKELRTSAEVKLL